MDNKTIIKWTNRIALFVIILLVYWVFIFISITVFGLKVFRENITELFLFVNSRDYWYINWSCNCKYNV